MSQFNQIPTDIPEFNEITRGGISKRSINVITGSPGCGKTILAHQLMFGLVKQGYTALYLSTVTEPTDKIIYHMSKFEYFNKELIGKQVFYRNVADMLNLSSIDAMTEFIVDLVKSVGADLLFIDSYRGLERFNTINFDNHKFAFTLSSTLSAWQTTAFFLGEYGSEENNSAVFTVADSIFKLTIEEDSGIYYRYLSIVKQRANGFENGLHPFEIDTNGINIYPIVKVKDDLVVNIDKDKRIKSGIAQLDSMLSGGLIKNSINMFSGSTGVGKTMLSLHYAKHAVENGQKVLVVQFQETYNQVLSFASSFNWDFEQYEKDNLFIFKFYSPTGRHANIVARDILNKIDVFQPELVIIDPINDLMKMPNLEKTGVMLSYSLLHQIKSRGATVITLNEISQLFGDFKLSDHDISKLTDTIVIMKYVELLGRLGRTMSVLKHRGSSHDKAVRTYKITETGIKIGNVLSALTGVLTGNPLVQDLKSELQIDENSRQVLKTTDLQEAISIDQIHDATGLDKDIITQEIQKLLDLGLIRSVKSLDDEIEYIKD